jgi:hypothetical protein
MELTTNAENILRFLVDCIKTRAIRAGEPQTYLGYKEIHDHLNLPMAGDTFGTSLSNQGLADLAMWARDNGLPAITGLVVDQTTYMPGNGYWLVNGKDEDFGWWKDQVQKSLEYDWNKLLVKETHNYQGELFAEEVPETPLPFDFEEPKEATSVLSQTYRILRDTELIRRLKFQNQFSCQICGTSISLNNDTKYVEGHHIKPLSQPHNGPDIPQNIICVCPNHHVQLDYGAIPLDKSNLRTNVNHEIGTEYIQYHNNNIWNKLAPKT